MKFRGPILAAVGLAALLCGCANAPGRPVAGDIPVVPSEVTDFKVLFGENCSGCHGNDGKGGAAIALADPVYLAIADDTVVRHATADGISGTSMPAFAQSAGGMLTDKQIDALVQGMRQRWAQPDALRGANPPPYSSSEPGDASRGSAAYAEFCSSCHGAGGRGGQRASSIVDGSFLALLNDQELRTIVIVGRPELGAPDWRANVPGKPMSPQDVSDVVTWLASQRAKFPGQPYSTSSKSTGEVR
ncbi:MAG: cytochrome c [Candidatus Acidiferrales bacterium]|jgi:cytochrome c oxidase cbb3-type subunit 3